MWGRLFNRWILERYGKIVAALSTAFSIAIVYIKNDCQKKALVGFVILLAIAYIGIALYANLKKRVTIKIGDTKIIIKKGDLFKEKGTKVIPMNEYFDTDTKNGIIDPNSIHGKYLEKYANKPPEELSADIIMGLQKKKPRAIDQKKENGSKVQYKLGTIYDDKQGFFLLAYSRFDKENRAYLKSEDIIQCYSNLWNEIDIYRGSKSIVFPVMGAGGIVRFDKHYTPQQLIELIIWSFRVSGIHLSRDSTLTIVVHKSLVHDIDFMKLSYCSD